MERENIYHIPLKRIVGEKELAEFYNSDEEFDKLYADMKKGELSTTSQINPEEFVEHFKKIIAKEKEGDIIQVSMSGGMSGTHTSAVIAANQLNPTLVGRQIYAFDSLSVSGGMQILLDKLMELNGKKSAAEALEVIEKMRENLQVFFMVDDLFHLKRGGRVSGVKAVIGTILGIKPILVINKQGKLAVIGKIKGARNAANYFTAKPGEYGITPDFDYAGQTIVIERTNKSEHYEVFRQDIKAKYPKANIKEVILGPIIGSHVGCGAVGVLFVGKPRLDVS